MSCSNFSTSKWSHFRIFVENSSLKFSKILQHCCHEHTHDMKCTLLLHLKCCVLRMVPIPNCCCCCVCCMITAEHCCVRAHCTLLASTLSLAGRDRSNNTPAGPGFFLLRGHISVDYRRLSAPAISIVGLHTYYMWYVFNSTYAMCVSLHKAAVVCLLLSHGPCKLDTRIR